MNRQRATSGSRSRRAVATGLALGLTGGAAAGLVLGVPGLTSARGESAIGVVQQAEPSDEAPAETGDDTFDRDTGDAGRTQQGRPREALDPLVDDGTITAAQADAVAEHLWQNRPDRNRAHPHWHWHVHPGGPAGRGAVAEAVAEFVGIDVETLRDQLREGATLADLAAANGVPLADLIDAIVGESAERLDRAVDAGRLTAERAAELAERLDERITARVNGEVPARD